MRALIQLLGRVAELLESHLGVKDGQRMKEANARRAELPLEATMKVHDGHGNGSAGNEQGARAVASAETERTGPVPSGACGKEAVASLEGDILETTQPKKRAGGRRFAFDRLGRNVVGTDANGPAPLSMDPLQFDVRNLMLDDGAAVAEQALAKEKAPLRGEQQLPPVVTAGHRGGEEGWEKARPAPSTSKRRYPQAKLHHIHQLPPKYPRDRPPVLVAGWPYVPRGGAARRPPAYPPTAAAARARLPLRRNIGMPSTARSAVAQEARRRCYRVKARIFVG